MTSLFPTLDKGATFSQCRRYRYLLTRNWDDSLPEIGFCCLNPSTADAEKDDATIRRCISFARAWGYGGMVVVNLFAWRATAPATLCLIDCDPIGEDNDSHLFQVAESVPLIVCAWGVHGKLFGRGQDVLKMLAPWKDRLRHLGLTKEGAPKHPLYLSATTRPMMFKATEANT